MSRLSCVIMNLRRPPHTPHPLMKTCYQNSFFFLFLFKTSATSLSKQLFGRDPSHALYTATLSCEETKSCTGFLSVLLKVFILSAILLILAENCACLCCKLQKNKTKQWLFPSVNNRAVLMIPHWTTHGFQNRLNAWRLEGCHQTPSSTWPSYRIDSGTGKLHPARPWTPAQSRSSRRLTQSPSWWSSVPTPRCRPRPARHRGPDPVVEQLDLQPPGWRHCGRTGPTGAEEGWGGPSGSSWSSVGTAGRLRGKQHKTQSQRRERNCRDLNFGLDAGTASYVEEQSPASISSFDLSVLLSLQISECVLVKEDSWISF